MDALLDDLLDAMIDVSIYMYTFNYSLIHTNYLSIIYLFLLDIMTLKS